MRHYGLTQREIGANRLQSGPRGVSDAMAPVVRLEIEPASCASFTGGTAIIHSVYRHLTSPETRPARHQIYAGAALDHRPMILLPRARIWSDRSQPVERQACAAWPLRHPTARIALEVGERGCTLSRWPPSVTGIPERWW